MGEEMAKHEEISQWLRERIQDGTYTASDRLPSENKLAANFGCCRQTIRQAIGSLVSEGLLTRTQGSGTFVSVPDNRKDATPQKATKRIGVLIACPEDFLFPDILQGIEEVLSEQQYTISLGITHNRPTDEESCLCRMLEDGVDGIIIEGTKTAQPNVNEMLYQKIKERSIPVVFLNSCHSGCRESYVILDDIRAGEIAAEALIAKGHTRIGGIFPSDDLRGIKRYEGFRNILVNNGLLLQENSVLWYTSEQLPSLFTGNPDDKILSCFSDITGFVCCNDQIAVSLLQLFYRCKRENLENCSVASIGNSVFAEFAADALLCDFISVRCPAYELGYQAAELMLKKLADSSCREQIILLPKVHS